MGAPLTILVVDDDADMRELMRIWLKSEGYSVRTAANGAEALADLQKTLPCVLLVDLHMPIMDGVALRRWQQGHQDIRDIPFILISGALDAERVGRELAASAVVPKPVDPARLFAALTPHCHRPA